MRFNSWLLQHNLMSAEVEILTVGVIGTPGCGKTTFCQGSNIPVVTVKTLAEQYGCLGEVESDGAAAVDVEKLSKVWEKPEKLTLVDGHLAHFLPVDALLVLRCDPEVLRLRLQQRGYSQEKIQQNVEVEMLGGPWVELLEDERPIYEGAEGALEWIINGCPFHSTPYSAIDWLSQP